MTLRTTLRPFDVGTDFHIADTTLEAVSSVDRSVPPRALALGFVFLWFLIGGIAHFVATDLEMRIVPPYVPAPRAVVLISGAFELLGALGLLLPGTRRIAAIGLFVLTVLVTPAHIYMLQVPELFPSIPLWLLWLRLPLQLLLLMLIASCVAPTAPRRRLLFGSTQR